MSDCLHYEDGACLTNLCETCYAEHRELKRMLADMLMLKQEYEAACGDRDAMARMCDDLRSTIRTMCSLIADWRDGNAHIGRPRSFVDQRFLDALMGESTALPVEVKCTITGQRGGSATFTHWSGTATKSEEP